MVGFVYYFYFHVSLSNLLKSEDIVLIQNLFFIVIEYSYEELTVPTRSKLNTKHAEHDTIHVDQVVILKIKN